jgi:hypothetical protein
MPATAILRGAAAALLFSLVSIGAAAAAHRDGHGPVYRGPVARMHVGPHRGGMIRTGLHRRHHAYGGIGYGRGHHRFDAPRHHARAAFFPRARYGYRHNRPRFHGGGYGVRHGYLPRQRFFGAEAYGFGGHGHGAPYAYGAGYAAYAPPAYGTVAGAAPYGPLYNRPIGDCY